tara:strand:+ start:2858 stop:3517 length:660 start_codon:yes stop_codon:yes gene_type:complete
MKLIFTPNPEYIHKVLVVAHEAGILDKISMEIQVPFDENTEIWKYNPLGKVPSFVTKNNEPLFGGLIICEYLDSFNTKAPLFPKDSSKWTALRQMITGDGIFDATTLIRVESWREKNEWNKSYMLRERKKIVGGLKMLEEDAKNWNKNPNTFHIGHVATAGALSYLYLRNPIQDCNLVDGDDNFDWANDHPNLKQWFADIQNRPSIKFRLSKEDVLNMK